MAASLRAGSSNGLSLPKWQIALAVGAPVAIGFGIWYYKFRNKKTIEPVGGEPRNGNAAKTELTKIQETEAPKLENKEPAKEIKAEETDPFKLSQSFKNKGNKFFKEGKYSDAIKCYQKAIDVCPKDKTSDISTFYQNRAAAFEQLKNHEAVINDCTKALEYNPKYTKALHRRAKALELLKRYENCLEDITAVCILEAFQNQSSLLMADRVLKELGKQHAKEAITQRQPVIPSSHFINTFICSFSEDPIFQLLSSLEEGDTELTGFAAALHALKNKNYSKVILACTEELDSNTENESTKHLARLLRGTFHTLMGEHDNAVQDFTILIDNSSVDNKVRVNALVKRATLRMQLGSSEESLYDLSLAAELDPTNADVFHHRGQVYMLLDQVIEAMNDFEKAVTLNSNFPIALVQKLYTDYRLAFSVRDMNKVQKVMNSFEDAISRFPQCPECYLLYAQVLSDQQEYKKADDYFKRALEVDPNNATAFVHRGLLQLQWEGDVSAATKLIQQAINLDPKCEFAYETLGTIEVQRGNLKQAIELFDKAIPLSKTEIEMSHLFSLKDAALAQVKVAEKLGVTLPSV